MRTVEPAIEKDRAALCALLRGERRTLADDRLRALSELATDHRVHALLAEALSRQHDDGPMSHARLALQEAVRREAIVEWLRAEDLKRLLATIADAHVPVLLIKGVALAYTCYEQPSHRPHVDIDLLIRQEHADVVRHMMEQGGYVAPNRVDGERISRQFQYTKRLPTGADCEYDFHWRIANPELFAQALTFDALDASARSVAALGRHARVPSNVHSLFIACIHRVAHHYDDDALVWLYDIHLLASRLDQGEWYQLIGLATQTRTRTICVHGLRAAHDAFGTVLPAALLERLATTEPEPSAAFLAPALRTIDVELSTFHRLPTWRARAELVWQHLFPKPAFILRSYGVTGRAWLPVLPLLPLLYVHRAVRGVFRWLRPLDPRRRS
jgi:hypothetical protein